MTQPHPQPKLEYIITEEMLQQWRVGCIYPSASIQFDDQKCCTCKYAGEGFRLHCCDFDDDSMEKIFRSRPHSPAAPATEYTIEQIAEINNRTRKAREDEREKMLEEINMWIRAFTYGIIICRQACILLENIIILPLPQTIPSAILQNRLLIC